MLAGEGLALVDTLDLDDYDLVGYSLAVGGWCGCWPPAPGRLEPWWPARDSMRQPAHRPDPSLRRVLTAMLDGTPLEPEERVTADWLAHNGADRLALLLVLDSLIGTSVGDLGRITVPTLVLIGQRDTRGSAEALAAAIPAARFARVPGDHDALLRTELTAAILDFLDV